VFAPTTRFQKQPILQTSPTGLRHPILENDTTPLG
jgi:hypothetical protein